MEVRCSDLIEYSIINIQCSMLNKVQNVQVSDTTGDNNNY